MKKDISNIAKLQKVLQSVDANGSFYLKVETDVDVLMNELKSKYDTFRYCIAITDKLSINIYND